MKGLRIKNSVSSHFKDVWERGAQGVNLLEGGRRGALRGAALCLSCIIIIHLLSRRGRARESIDHLCPARNSKEQKWVSDAGLTLSLAHRRSQF